MMRRTIRNEIAQRLLDGTPGFVYPVDHRQALTDAQDAVDVLSALVVIHGPDVVLDAIMGQGRG